MNISTIEVQHLLESGGREYPGSGWVTMDDFLDLFVRLMKTDSHLLSLLVQLGTAAGGQGLKQGKKKKKKNTSASKRGEYEPARYSFAPPTS